MVSTPIEERLAYAPGSSGGRFTPNGVASFVSRFSSQESLNEFLRWRESPVTMAYLAALRGLMVNLPPSHMNRENVELQYGVQCGLTLATSLMDDPTSLYPRLFTGSTSGPGTVAPDALPTEYTTAPDSLDQ